MLAKGLGLTPTVTSLDMFASEVVREVDEAVVAFEFLADKNLKKVGKNLRFQFDAVSYTHLTLPTNREV